MNQQMCRARRTPTQKAFAVTTFITKENINKFALDAISFT
jgi:hypothetical protein